MQQKLLHKKFDYVRDIDTTEYSDVVYQRKDKLLKFNEAVSCGCSEEEALSLLDLKRSTYFRWKKNYKLFGLAGLEDASRRPNNVRKQTWTKLIEDRVYHLRKQHPEYGKEKITVKYRAFYREKISESMVGRILKKLVEQNKVMPVRFLFGKKDTKRRIFNGHAQRWKFGTKAKKIGELIQIDHMTTSIVGQGELKHFNAICPITKWVVSKVYKTATSQNATDFLQYIQATFPFKILSIQVDGGGEFMGDFEKACAQNNIPLFVLPPRSPEFNAHVERANGTFKYEFYSRYDKLTNLHMIQKNLQKFTHYYNKDRPHKGIGLLTPWQYFESIKEKALESHMS